MTTIVTDGKSMSSDSLETAGDVVVGWRTKKMWRLDDGRIVGCAGKVSDIHKFLAWLEEDDERAVPKMKEMSALILHPNGEVELFDEDGIGVPVEVPAAIGTGYISALTAIDMGADTKKAVQMAIKRDVNSGGPVQTFSL